MSKKIKQLKTVVIRYIHSDQILTYRDVESMCGGDQFFVFSIKDGGQAYASKYDVLDMVVSIQK